MTHSFNIISANHLRTGLNVYFRQEGETGEWLTQSDKATVYTDETISAAFEMAQKAMDENLVVDCIIVPVDENHAPLTTREKIRAKGPSIPYGTSNTP